MEEARNIVQLRGEALGEPVLSHENHGQRFYRFLLFYQCHLLYPTAIYKLIYPPSYSPFRQIPAKLAPLLSLNQL